MKNRLTIINTGGTFSSRKGPFGLSPAISAGQIEALVGGFMSEKEIRIEDFSSVDSANITPYNWQCLAKRIASLEETNDGIVIIHGTDTMAYTASMLGFMLQGIPIPVILTGSQLPLGVPMSDAPDNCRCAIQAASSTLQGVFVVFNRKVMLGVRTSKVRTVSFDAFESINYPCIGEFNAYGLKILNKRIKKPDRYSVSTQLSTCVAVVKLFPGMDPNIFDFLSRNGYHAIYIEGFGLGGVPFIENDITQKIKDASEKGLSILVGSQCRYEGSDLSVYETGKRILECGGIPVRDMTEEAVVTKLMICLGKSKEREYIKKMFAANLIDEITI